MRTWLICSTGCCRTFPQTTWVRACTFVFPCERIPVCFIVCQCLSVHLSISLLIRYTTTVTTPFAQTRCLISIHWSIPPRGWLVARPLRPIDSMLFVHPIIDFVDRLLQSPERTKIISQAMSHGHRDTLTDVHTTLGVRYLFVLLWG